jgi:UDP-N-acetylmuramyl tripeptide synthase
VIAGKLSAKAIRIVGAGLGSNLPGRVSRALSRTVLSNLAKQAKLGVVAVSGTNGKSTTSGFVSSVLQKAGHRIAHNRQGANLVPGITASLIDAARWDGKLDVDYCLFETDEAALPLVAKEVAISTILVTNLFRDQLDRFGELDTTASLINKGIAVNHSQAILNADDPNVAQLAPDSKRMFYGIESIAEWPRDAQSRGSAAGADAKPSTASANEPAAGVQELAYCGKCGSEYSYNQTFYGQLGHYTCKSCGNSRPKPDVVAEEVRVGATGSSFNLRFEDRVFPVKVALPGLFNVYNALAAAALGLSLKLPDKAIADGVESYTTLFGRSERWQIRGKTALIQLIKNPAGASQAVRAAVNDPNARILVAINDNYADGRDVSWLWDAEFELMGSHTKPICVSGTRAYDMAVRLKYSGIPAENINVISSLEDALSKALDETSSGETLWILPTYTCLLELQRIAKSMGSALSGT